MKLTKSQHEELQLQMTKGPQPTFGTHRTRVQNRLVQLGLSEFLDWEGHSVRCSVVARSCSITPAGREALHTFREWRCFHCDEVFVDKQAAEAHFGSTEIDKPICQLDAAYVRGLEAELARYRGEDTDLHRQIYGMQADHAVALRRAEEQGYARGLHDGRNDEGD